MKEYFRKPYMTQGIGKHSDYMKAIPQRAIDVQGQIAPNIEFKKPYDYHPNTAQMIHYYANNLHYLGGDPVPPLNDPSLLPHAPIVEVLTEPFIDSVSGQPLSSASDGYLYSGAIESTQAYLYFYYKNFVLFPSILIPKSAFIDNAVLTVTARTNVTTSSTQIIYGNKIPNATAPTTEAQYNALIKTGSSISWVIPAFLTGVSYDSPDVKSIIQEIVDQANWKSNNNLMLLIEGSVGAVIDSKNPYSYDGSATLCPKLTIKFH